MSDVHSCFSDRLKKVTLALVTATLLGGCSMTTYDNKQHFEADNRSFFEKLKKEPASENTNNAGESSVSKVDPQTTDSVGLALRDNTSKNVEAFNINPANLKRGPGFEDSAACRYLRKSADSEAVIIGSPTLSASSDEEGSGSVSIGMNLLDFKKSELVRASGDARCRLHEASKKIDAAVGLGGEATKFARAWAKQDYIRSNMTKLNQIKSQTASLVEYGLLTRQDANLVIVQIEGLKSEMAIARAEADQRRDLPAITANDVRSRHGALVEATSDLQNIEREIRTTDALELSVSAGYRYNEAFNSDLQRTDSDGAFAKVSVGIRLGALSAQRQSLEDEAAGARVDALFEENTGTIWKSGVTDKATSRVIAELKASETSIANAMRLADSTIAQLEKNQQPETTRAVLNARIERIRLGSDHAAVKAAIRQLETNQQNIKALSQ